MILISVHRTIAMGCIKVGSNLSYKIGSGLLNPKKIFPLKYGLADPESI